tara:strand:+ start:2715 stop:3224 length:510 start_codon:yes stop_codon:yes gene_type:complete
MNKTYNNVIDTLSCISLAHGLVNEVSTGDIENIDTSGIVKYPLVHIVPTSVDAGTNTLTFNFNILAMDLVNTDESNEQEVLSNTLIILTDILAEYKNGKKLGGNLGDYLQEDLDSFNLEPFTERFDNVVSGWNCTYSITIPHVFNACNSFNWDYIGGIAIDGGAVDCRK